MTHTDFVNAFKDRARFAAREGLLTVAVKELGELRLRSGKLVVCDPLAAWQLEPLARAVPAGRFPVSVSIVRYSNRDERIAAAMVSFLKTRPVRWQMATRRGEALSALKKGQAYGTGVDAGMVGYLDAADAPAIEGAGDAILAARDKTYKHTRWWTQQRLGEGNVVAFSSGWGDGCYSSWWGLDARGRLCALATDFGLLVEAEMRAVGFEALTDRKGMRLRHADLDELGVEVRLLSVQPRRVKVETRGPEAEVRLVDWRGTPLPVRARIHISRGRRTFDLALAKASVVGAGLMVSVQGELRPMPAV